MNIIEELKKIKKEFENKDRRNAMEAFMQKMYYEIAPCVSFGDTVELFRDEKAVENFCNDKRIDIRAFRWLLGELRNEGLLQPYSVPIALTELGVGKLCIEK